MRHLALIPLSAAALLTAAVSDSSASSARPRRDGCPAGHANVVAADAQVEVFTAKQTVLSDSGRPLDPITVYRGCVFGKARSFILGEVSTFESCTSRGCDTTVSNVTLAGPLVAYERSFTTEQTIFEPGSGSWTVIVRDLRSGRLLRTVPTGLMNPPDRHYVGVGSTTAIVLQRNGSVAWIAEAGGHNLEVHAADHSGARLLASGPDIGGRSLALAGSTLYWTENGMPFSAELN